MTAWSTACSRTSWTRETSHATAGWNHKSARTHSSSTAHSQSRRRTCSSSWQAIARCASGAMPRKLSGSNTAGRRTPNVMGAWVSRELKNSAATATADWACSTAASGPDRGVARRRRPRNIHRPTTSHAPRIAMPAATIVNTTPADGQGAGLPTGAAPAIAVAVDAVVTGTPNVSRGAWFQGCASGSTRHASSSVCQ
jgi:hypothetical protein